MAKRRIILELQHNAGLASTAVSAESDPAVCLNTASVPKIAGVQYDEDFAPVFVPNQMIQSTDDSLTATPESSCYVVRCEMDEKKASAMADNPPTDKGIVGVYSDVEIKPQTICPGDPPLGTDATVERLLCTEKMHALDMDGSGVLVAIVDTGINMSYLNGKGKNPNFDAGRSWVPQPGLTPGALPVGHGTMCAFDACIAAPKCTLLDIALLQSKAGGPTVMSGFLSDGIRAYRHLIAIMKEEQRPGEGRSMVVNNSWGMFHPSWDFPLGHPGNYSDNYNHPFNRIVGELERVGADILFAAGNCGKDCPDGRCQGVTANAIYGANGHSSVTCVAGVDTKKQRVGYSTIGPGRLTRDKPDISGYTHFKGSGVYAADGGTSAATPVVSGVVAAIRSKRPYQPSNPSRSPAAIRNLITTTAEDLGTAGYDFEHGYGVINGCAITDRVVPKPPPKIPSFCDRYPIICRYLRFCRRYPWACRRLPPLPIPRGPRLPLSEFDSDLGSASSFGDVEADSDLSIDEILGFVEEMLASGLSGIDDNAPASKTDCGCGGSGKGQ